MYLYIYTQSDKTIKKKLSSFLVYVYYEFHLCRLLTRMVCDGCILLLCFKVERKLEKVYDENFFFERTENVYFTFFVQKFLFRNQSSNIIF